MDNAQIRYPVVLPQNFPLDVGQVALSQLLSNNINQYVFNHLASSYWIDGIAFSGALGSPNYRLIVCPCWNQKIETYQKSLTLYVNLKASAASHFNLCLIVSDAGVSTVYPTTDTELGYLTAATGTMIRKLAVDNTTEWWLSVTIPMTEWAGKNVTISLGYECLTVTSRTLTVYGFEMEASL